MRKNKSIIGQLRNLNIILFLIIAGIMFVSMFYTINNISNTVSKDYAKLYADNAVGKLNTYLNEEIALITKVAQSNAIIDWFKDEENQTKKNDAYEEIMSTINVSSSKHLYIGVLDSLNEYNVEGNYLIEDVVPLAKLSDDFDKDNWFFECLSSEYDYLLNVDIDKAYQRELVWLNCKVQKDGVVYGVVCVGLEFSHILDDLFSEYDNNDVRSLIIDEAGNIQMDSFLSGSENFIYAIDDQRNIKDEFNKIEYLNNLDCLKNRCDYDAINDHVKVISLSEDKYQYVTIAPIDATTWTVVTLYNSSALFDITMILPIFFMIIIIFIFLIIATNSLILSFFINPFKKLVKSIEMISFNLYHPIYGLNRSDEIGELAKSVDKMKCDLIEVLNKVHYDSLTGIYNRRYLDENIDKIFKSLSREHRYLSILMIDIDFFKKYNDTYGHSAGDDCLKLIASILTKCSTRQDDFVARYGGEEFIVVLPDTKENGAYFVANKIIEATKTMAIPHKSSLVIDYVTVSIGIKCGKVEQTTQALDYINLADEALYTSKQTGRNKFTMHK